jgi:Skp family chaperone for outer membrane proteins
LLVEEELPSTLLKKFLKFSKGAHAMARKMELLQDQLDRTQAAEAARKLRKRQSNRVLQNGGILYAKDARSMTRDRLELEEERAKKRQEFWEKRYTTALKKVFKSIGSVLSERKKQRNAFKRVWKRLMKEVVNRKGRCNRNPH